MGSVKFSTIMRQSKKMDRLIAVAPFWVKIAD
nr:MAG TPA: hypothetical protein [Caudoviricetes sp.]